MTMRPDMAMGAGEAEEALEEAVGTGVVGASEAVEGEEEVDGKDDCFCATLSEASVGGYTKESKTDYAMLTRFANQDHLSTFVLA